MDNPLSETGSNQDEQGQIKVHVGTYDIRLEKKLWVNCLNFAFRRPLSPHLDFMFNLAGPFFLEACSLFVQFGIKITTFITKIFVYC